MERLVFLCVMFLVLPASRLFATPDVLRMQTGDVRTLHLAGSNHIYISKRGVISLTKDRDDYWTLIALKSGLVNVQSSMNDGQTKTIIIDVTPRQPRSGVHFSTRNNHQNQEQEFCTGRQRADVFLIKSTIELEDDASKENSGFEHELKIKVAPETIGIGFNAQGTPEINAHHRRIIANPEVISKPCTDVLIRTGGEDAVETRTDEGRTVTTWKSHGLDLKVKLIPTNDHAMLLPFSVSLRTPSKGQGNYGLTDVHSEVEVALNQKILAATINLSSASAFERNQAWFAATPIIGPFFRRKDDSKAESKMLVWFEVSQNSVERKSP